MTDCYEAGDALHGYRIRAEDRKISDLRVIATSGRHKARRILTENAGAVIERKLGRIKMNGLRSHLIMQRPIG
jgi:hypothetical protein